MIPLLIRHFLRGFTTSDVSGHDGEDYLTAGNILAFLAVPGTIYAMGLAPKYGWMVWHLGSYGNPLYMPLSLGDKFLFVTLALVMVGFVTVLRWDALFLSLCDYMALTPLPLGPFPVLAAKVASLAIAVALLAISVNLGATFIFPAIALWKSPSYLMMLRSLIAHGVSVFGASIFVFLLLLAIQGTMLTLFGYRWYPRVSPVIQFALLLWLGNQFLLVPDLKAILVKIQAGSQAGWFFPTLWFLGLYEQILGLPDPIFLPLAHRAVVGLCCVAGLAALTYATGYARHLHRSLDTDDNTEKRPMWPARVLFAAADRWILRDPRERASFHFAWQTVVRNPTHRLFLSAYIGVGAAVVLEGLAAYFIGTGQRAEADTLVALYSLPLVISFFLLSGLRTIFSVPAELQANWIFQLAEDDRRTLLLAGTRKAVLAIGLVPLFAVLFLTYSLWWGVAASLVHVLYGFTLSWMLLEALLWGFAKVPFTCTYQPGKINIPTAGLLYLFAFSLYGFTMASFERWLLVNPLRVAIYFIVVGCLLGAVARYRERLIAADLRLLFEDQPDPEVRTLGIG